MGKLSKFNIFQSGALVGKIETKSHASLQENPTGWKRKNRELLMRIDGKAQNQPKKVKKKHKRGKFHIELGKKVEGLKYAEYMKSKRWKVRRIMYFQKFGRKCVVCKGTRNIGLHHLSYERLGGELDEDLVVLCWGCHEEYHRRHGVKRESKEDTYNFIQEEQETRELSDLIKNL
jgi:hypothetical protein